MKEPCTLVNTFVKKDTWDPTDDSGVEKFGVSALKGDYFGWHKNGNNAQGDTLGVYYPVYCESTPRQIAAWRAQDPVKRAYYGTVPRLF